MSTPTVLNNATIWLGGYDLTGASNEITFNAARADLNSSRFGDSVEAVHPGVVQVDAEVKGYFDSSLDGPLVSQLQSPTAAWPLTVCPDGADLGEVAYNIEAYNFGYAVFETGWGESLPYRLSGKSKSGGVLGRGTVMLPKVAYAVYTAGTLIQLGAVAATQKLVATLHVFAIDGGTWTVSVASDVDATPGGGTGRASFTAVTTAPTREVIEVPGAVTDTWWYGEVNKVGGTSITCAVTFAIVDA